MLRKILNICAVSAAILGLGTGLASAQTLKIGVIAPLTGGASPWGKAVEQATRIATAEVNAKGGLMVGGKPYQLEVVAYDDQYKAADALAAFNRLVSQDQVKYMVVFSSPSAIAVKQKVEEEKVIAITAGGAKEVVDENTHHLFRLNTLPDGYMGAVVKWMSDNTKDRRIALINPNDPTGWVIAQSTEPLFKAAGFEVVTTELYERSQTDFQGLLTKVLALKPGVIDIGSTPPATAGLMVRQLRDLGYKGAILKTGGPGWKEIVAGAGPAASEGTICLLYADPQNENVKRLNADYMKAVGQEPNEMIVLIYDGVRAMLAAIQKGGDVNNTEKTAAAFAAIMPMKTLQGDEMTLAGKQFSGVDQQLMVPNFIGVIKNGGVQIVGKVK